MSTYIYAFSQDTYWLNVIKKIRLEAIQLKIIQCSGAMPDCFKRLPDTNSDALILVDAYGHSDDIRVVIQNLRNLGWKYVVVITADPTVKESLDVLREQLGFDYWAKTYVASSIRLSITKCLAEIQDDRKSRVFPTR